MTYRKSKYAAFAATACAVTVISGQGAGAVTEPLNQGGAAPNWAFECDGGYTNWSTARNGSANVNVTVEVGGGHIWPCNNAPSAMLLHANRCDSFTSQGSEAAIRDPQMGGGPWWGSSAVMPKPEPCWRYSTRAWQATGSGSGVGGEFRLTHTYK